MVPLIAFAAAFIGIHLFVSGTPLRDRIVTRIGAGAYMGAFSAASAILLVVLIMSYLAVKTVGPVWWAATPVTRHIQSGLMLVAILLIVGGLMTPNPTSVAQEGTLSKPELVRGLLRITRHPFLWGVFVWAIGHLLVNGDLPGLIFFGSFALLSCLGTSSIDAKRKRALGDNWDAFASATSNIPFAAILSGRQTFRPGEIGLLKAGVSVAVYLALYMFHGRLFGVSVA